MPEDVQYAPDGRQVIDGRPGFFGAWATVLPLRDALLTRGNSLFRQLAQGTDDFTPAPDCYYWSLGMAPVAVGLIHDGLNTSTTAAATEDPGNSKTPEGYGRTVMMRNEPQEPVRAPDGRLILS